MAQILEDVRSGKYAAGWIAENEKGRPWFNQRRDAERNAPIEQVGARLRALMPFLKPVAVEEQLVKS
jgi:ketol-acid reductoisomerase